MTGKCICHDHTGKDNDREYTYAIMGTRKKIIFQGEEQYNQGFRYM